MKKQLKYLSLVLFFGVFYLVLGGQTAFATAPPNDNFAASETIVLSSGSFVGTRNNISGSKEVNEPNHAQNIGGSSVWFIFTPTSTQIYRIKTTNPSTAFDTTLAVYTGDTLASLVRIGYNDDCMTTGCGTSSMVDLMLTAGTTYRIAIDGYNSGVAPQTGSFVLSINEITTPVTYNAFGTPYDLGTITSGSIAGTNYLATAQVGEPGGHSNSPPQKTVWYRMQVPNRKAMIIDLELKFAAQAAIYEATVANPTFDQLNELDTTAFNLTYNYDSFQMDFAGIPNRYYFIQIGFYDVPQNPGPEGNFQITVLPAKLRYSTRVYKYASTSSVSVWRPSDGIWYAMPTLAGGSSSYVAFGLPTDVPVPSDYDGEGRTNYAVTRNQNGLKQWYILHDFISTTYSSFQWGLASDKEIAGDFDRDGIADPTVIREVNGHLVWYVRQSSNSLMRAFVYGLTGDRPVLGDFDGDGATEVAVVRQDGANLVWHMLRSNGVSYANATSEPFGLTDDLPAAEDFDGDGKTDLAVFRPSNGTWYILRSGTGQLQVTPFGAAGDKPQPADYDGDHKADLAVYRPTTGNWHIWTTYFDDQYVRHWGSPGDVLVASSARYSMPSQEQ